MSYAEFPHTNYADWDLRELIDLYKKVESDYAGTLNEITEVSKRLDEYESNMDAKILAIDTTTIPQAVSRAISEAMYQYQQEVNTRFNEMSIRISTVETMYDSIQNDIQREIGGVRNDLDLLRQELLTTANNLQTQINNFNSQVDRIMQETREFEKNILGEMNILREDVKTENESLKEEINSDTSKFKHDIIAEIDYFEKEVKNNLLLNENDYTLRDSITLAKANEYTDRKVSALHTLIESLNLASNVKQLRWVWQYGCCFGGYNAIQWYNETPITCEEWNKSEISCIDWYIRGREVFKWFDRRKFMFSPVSGRYVDVREALLELATALKINGLTAEDYDRLGFTAEEYDSYKESAGEYDWNGRELLEYVHKTDPDTGTSTVAT